MQITYTSVQGVLRAYKRIYTPANMLSHAMVCTVTTLTVVVCTYLHPYPQYGYTQYPRIPRMQVCRDGMLPWCVLHYVTPQQWLSKHTYTLNVPMDICYILSYHVVGMCNGMLPLVYATLRYHHNSVLQWLRIHTYTPVRTSGYTQYPRIRPWQACVMVCYHWCMHMLTVYTACMLTPMLRAITCYHRMVYPLCIAMCTPAQIPTAVWYYIRTHVHKYMYTHVYIPTQACSTMYTTRYTMVYHYVAYSVPLYIPQDMLSHGPILRITLFYGLTQSVSITPKSPIPPLQRVYQGYGGIYIHPVYVPYNSMYAHMVLCRYGSMVLHIRIS